MAKVKQSNAALYWVIAVIVIAMGAFVSLFVSDAPKTLAKIKLSYFTDEQEVVDSVGKRLFQELNKAQFFWVGMEPTKKEQLPIILQFKKLFETRQSLVTVIVDRELSFTEQELQALGATETFWVKEGWAELGKKLKQYEDENKSYLVITAAIYSTSLLPQNPLHKIKTEFKVKPTTFSIAYFATTIEDEKKLIFKCNTEDSSGTKEWGCFAVNKGRAARRKFDEKNQKPWVGLMDLTGETDYALLLKKR